FSSRRRHTRFSRDWSSDVCSSDLQASIDAQAGKPASPVQPPVRFDADALIPGKVPYASPAVRLFARELGVDLGQVTGTARGGRITKEDVQKYVKGVLTGGAAAPGA